MTISFENNNDIIVYTLETIISFARNNHYIFIAQCIWWISSIIGLQQKLIKYIDHHKIWINIGERKVSMTSRDLQEDQGIDKSRSEADQPTGNNHIHLNRIPPIRSSNVGSGDSETEVLDAVLRNTERFIQKSRKERWALNQNNKAAPSHKTRSGIMAIKPLTKKQRNWWWAIPTDSLSVYINNRV